MIAVGTGVIVGLIILLVVMLVLVIGCCGAWKACAIGVSMCSHAAGTALDSGLKEAERQTRAATQRAEAERLFADTLAWLQEHLDEAVTVEDLARRSAMSPRTFARRFRAVTGTTPLQWVLRQRVLLAQRLLESTDEPVERIAERCGFGSAAGLRQHFHRLVRTSPLAYRNTFRQAEAG